MHSSASILYFPRLFLQLPKSADDVTIPLPSGGTYTLCVSVITTSGTVSSVGAQCSQITVLPLACDAATTSWPQCAGWRAPDTTNWLAIGIACGIALLLIVLVIIVVALVLRSRRAAREKERERKDLEAAAARRAQVGETVSRGTGREFFDTLGEVSTLSVGQEDGWY